MWTIITFGKHRGITMPQLVFKDPDYLYWAIENGVFTDNYTSLYGQAIEVARKASRIRIPGNDGHLVAEYFIHPSTGKFACVKVVPVTMPQHEGSSQSLRLPYFDFSVPRQICRYDKLGGRLLLQSVKFYCFGKEDARVTKKRVESFFENSANFDA